MLPDLLRLIGSDRYLSPDEVNRVAGPHSLTEAAWAVYASHFDGFTGATLDPLFHRLSHPATRTGRVRLGDATTVLVAGTGPSLLTQIDQVARVRGRIRIFASAAAAGLLHASDIVPDLVVMDASSTSTEAASGFSSPGGASGFSRKVQPPLVAAEWRTPGALLAGLPQEALFVPSPPVTWGRWEATAVAMAADAGASRIALLGIDGEDAALTALLELIARLASFTAFDCGGSPKRGWVSASVREIGGVKLKAPLETTTWEAPRVEARVRQLQAELDEIAPVIERARRLSASPTGIDGVAGEIVAWRDQPRLRLLIQECLGVSLLPRLWREDMDRSLARTRRLRLALSEIVAQAEALGRIIPRAA